MAAASVFLINTASERAHEQVCRERPTLNDTEFVERFYAGTEIPVELLSRLRRVYAVQLAMDKVQPDDDVIEILPDLDVIEMVYEVEEEFGIKFTKAELNDLEGTFDWMARSVHKKLSLPEDAANTE